MSNKLLEILNMEGSELAREFQKASITGRGTSQEIADFREGYFHKLIERYFPFPHRITKGNIIDSFGAESASIDAVLLNPIHPYTVNSHGKFSVILADGVDFAVEIKPDISVKSELHRGLKQIQSVKRLRRSESALLPRIGQGKHPEHLVDYYNQITTFIFSTQCKSDPLSSGKDILEYYSENIVPIDQQFDFIVINDIGIISNYKYPEISSIRKSKTGIFFEKWGKLTMAAFLIKCNIGSTSTIHWSSPIINRYLPGLAPENVQKIEP